MPDSPRPVARIDDPTTMRALAHPVRLRLLGELRTHGPRTVGGLCDLLDEAPGSVSYHVGRLAAAGLVEEAPELARDRRQRWWRAAHAQSSWDPAEALAGPERAAAYRALQDSVRAGLAHEQQRYLDVEPTLPREWVTAAVSGDAVVHLTAPELAELSAELEALAERWQQRSDPAREGAAPAWLIYSTFRKPE
ncbi:ArsR/SmtB family transcription factor [Kineococcus xinjiangensis]|uniref:ArsR/SmtB family transcription factor n=1 Tax=Kineococcus xinjiangensis TaxID=512762 RepID=UPI001B802D25|nr:helix-turn-helix domain-containing protein [Kineococcus xinjiangensis]